MDRISEGIESLHLQRLAEEESISRETLETVLEKQDLLMSAVSDLTRKMDNLLSNRARVETPSPDHVERAAHAETIPIPRSGRPLETKRNEERTLETEIGNLATKTVEIGPANEVELEESVVEDEDGFTTRVFPDSPEDRPVSNRRDKFGALSRRRRRGILALLLLGLLAVAVPAMLLVTIAGEEAEQASVGEEEVEQSATNEQPVEVGSPTAEESEEEDPSTLEVPDFVGLTFLEAEAELAEAGLEVGELREEISYETPEGVVISQEPLAGVEVESGAPMDLVVSAGPPKVAGGPVIGDAGIAQYPTQDLPSPVGGAQYPDGTVRQEPFVPEPFVPVVPEVS